MRRRTFFGCLAAGCVPSLAAEPELRVAVNRTTIESAPLLVQPIPGVRIVLVANGRAASAQLVGAMVDAATGSETQALLNSVAQPDLRIVLTLAECRYRLVARRSAGIRNLADLRGRRIAVTRKTSAEYFLAEMLAAARLHESDVAVVALEGPAMPAALSRHEVDAMAMWEPHAQNALDALGADALVLENPSGYRERFNLNTTRAVLDDPAKHRLLVNLARAVRAVSNQLENAPRGLQPKLAQAIATPETVLAKAWRQFRFPAALDSSKLLSALEAIEPWAAALAQRQARPSSLLAPIIDTSIGADAQN